MAVFGRSIIGRNPSAVVEWVFAMMLRAWKDFPWPLRVCVCRLFFHSVLVLVIRVKPWRYALALKNPASPESRQGEG